MVVALISTTGHAQQAPRASIDFATDIQPILQANCVSCHGDALKLSRLDLRTRESALNGGANGPALVPGNADGSRLYRRIAGLEEPAMPMQRTPLGAADVEKIKL